MRDKDAVINGAFLFSELGLALNATADGVWSVIMRMTLLRASSGIESVFSSFRLTRPYVCVM